MGEYQVLRFERRNTRALSPGSLVYIRQTAGTGGGTFRITVGANGAAGSVTQLSGGSLWTPVPGGLSVDTRRRYAAVWLTPTEAANFRTEVLLDALDGRASYRSVITAADETGRRLRVAHFSPVTITTINEQAPQRFRAGEAVPYTLNGETRNVNFIWRTRWQTSATSGYIVQEVTTRITAGTCNGNLHDLPGNHYFEAWGIRGPNAFDPNGIDHWTIEIGPSTRGYWTKTARVFWVPTLDPSWHMSQGGFAAAGSLLSGVLATDLGTVLLRRTIGGIWNGCGHVLTFTHEPYPAGTP